MYKVKYNKSFKNEFLRLEDEVQKIIIQKWIPKLKEDPNIGKNFKGVKVKHFKRLAFRYKRNDYRIVYKIIRNQIIFFIAVGSRENFYKKFTK